MSHSNLSIMKKHKDTKFPISLENIYRAKVRLRGVADHTPLKQNLRLSEKYDCNILLKREDLQVVRSYKIRGAYNKMSSLSKEELDRGIICASAGNHAQGVAFACWKMGVHGKIYMPSVTPSQKIEKVRLFGKQQVEVILVGDTYDDAYAEAKRDAEENKKIIIHPFNDQWTIEGQGVVGLEIIEDAQVEIDYLFAPIGGGGLVSGVGSYFKQISPETKLVGVEPQGAPSMTKALAAGKVVRLEHIDPFVDGAAVKQVGDITFSICRRVLDDVVLIPEGKVCTTILELYNGDGMVVEPAGALSIAALDQYKEQIKGKNVVCIVSGGNNDITRTEEIKERSLLYEGLKHYFIIQFPQRAGALKEFIQLLGPSDDITRFEYSKKNSKASGSALVGIEVTSVEDYQRLIGKMRTEGINFQVINGDQILFNWFV